jgi:hypothetical protein
MFTQIDKDSSSDTSNKHTTDGLVTIKASKGTCTQPRDLHQGLCKYDIIMFS